MFHQWSHGSVNITSGLAGSCISQRSYCWRLKVKFVVPLIVDTGVNEGSQCQQPTAATDGCNGQLLTQ